MVKEALRRIEQPARRLFLRHTLTLGGLSLLTGCAIVDEDSVEHALMKVSRFNDRVQGWLFDPKLLAPTYPESMITRPFPFNAYYDEDEVPRGRCGRLPAGGQRSGDRSARLDPAGAARLPQTDQITRHICVEGWSAIGRWGGVPFADFLARIGADTSAKYVGFKCADNYYTSIDMPTALHPQTLLTLSYDGQVLPPRLRLSDEAAHADQARLQESEAHPGDVRHQHLSRRLLGGPGVQLVRRQLSPNRPP